MVKPGRGDPVNLAQQLHPGVRRPAIIGLLQRADQFVRPRSGCQRDRRGGEGAKDIDDHDTTGLGGNIVKRAEGDVHGRPEA